MLFALICCSVLMLVSVLIWLAVVFHPARAWDFQPVAEDVPAPPPPEAWPPVCILVPARNESETLPRTLPALLGQEYAGPLRVVLVDDRSTDGTAEVARRLGREAGAEGRLSVLEGQPLPDGWVGKVWALEQGRRHAAGLGAKYLLLTDADILHARHSLKRLVAESEAAELALNSRMALLRCQSGAERLLIPAFVFFFNLLYPMRWVNDPRHALAASAGGCVLLNAEALAAAGGLETIRGAIIDDVSLARAVKAPGRPLRLALSRNDVVSLRAYDDLDSVWSMVRRTAFTELGYSWLKLLGCIGMLAILFVLPPLAVAGGAMLAIQVAGGVWDAEYLTWAVGLTAKGLVAWGLMGDVYAPAVRFFGLPRSWAYTLPLVGLLYGLMTVDSAWKHLFGRQRGWR